MADVPTRNKQEPRIRIPLPEGWERTTKLDGETIRYAIRNPALAADGFTPNAVVTLQKIGLNVGQPQQILDAQNQQLQTKLEASDLTTTQGQLCGLPAESSRYTAPGMGKIPSRTARSLAVVYQGSDAIYVATLTVQTVDADNPTYVRDSALILKGFQLLPSE